MKEHFSDCIDNGLLNVVRYPKGKQSEYDRSSFVYDSHKNASVYGNNDAQAVVVTYGRVTQKAYEAAQILKERVNVKIVKLVKCYPFDEKFIFDEIKNAKLLYLLEEGIKSGGIAEKISSAVSGKFSGKVIVRAVDAVHAFHATTEQLYEHFGMTAENISEEILKSI